MKATITNLRALNAELARNGVKIELHELAYTNGKAYKGNAPIRAWGKTVDTSTVIMKAMLNVYDILKLDVKRANTN